MPHLNDWIKAQLKRGHNKKQIKNALIRKGYSQTAVAEVDKITSPRNDKKKLGLAVVLVIVVSLVFIYYSFQVAEKEDKIVVEEEPIAGEISTTTMSQTAILSCDEFLPVEGEITCEEAIELALQEYPGEIKNINKTQILMRVGLLPDANEQEKDVWLIGINLEEPLKMDDIEFNVIEAIVYRETGKLILYTLASG